MKNFDARMLFGFLLATGNWDCGALNTITSNPPPALGANIGIGASIGVF